MSLFTIVLFLHVLGAILAFGPTFAYSISGAMGGAEPQHANFAMRVTTLDVEASAPYRHHAADHRPRHDRGRRDQSVRAHAWWLLLGIVLYMARYGYGFSVQSRTSTRPSRSRRRRPRRARAARRPSSWRWSEDPARRDRHGDRPRDDRVPDGGEAAGLTDYGALGSKTAPSAPMKRETELEPPLQTINRPADQMGVWNRVRAPRIRVFEAGTGRCVRQCQAAARGRVVGLRLGQEPEARPDSIRDGAARTVDRIKRVHDPFPGHRRGRRTPSPYRSIAADTKDKAVDGTSTRSAMWRSTGRTPHRRSDRNHARTGRADHSSPARTVSRYPVGMGVSVRRSQTPVTGSHAAACAVVEPHELRDRTTRRSLPPVRARSGRSTSGGFGVVARPSRRSSLPPQIKTCCPDHAAATLNRSLPGVGAISVQRPVPAS